LPETQQRTNNYDQETNAAAGGVAHEIESVLFALAQVVEHRDEVTADHCERLAVTSLALGIALQLESADLLALYRGGYLHDLGKVGIPDAILFKPGRLTPEEWLIMRDHPGRGERICRPLKSLAPILPIMRHHHERWDGSGYPDGLRGVQIPLFARIVQIADIYDALTNPRPYKQPYTPKQALAIIEEETARGWRDPEIVTLFFRLHDDGVGTLEYTQRISQDLQAICLSLARSHRQAHGNAFPFTIPAWTCP